MVIANGLFQRDRRQRRWQGGGQIIWNVGFEFQTGSRDEFPIGEQHRTLNDVGELSDISWPRVMHQMLPRVHRQLFLRQSVVRAGADDEFFGQSCYVGASL